MLIPSSYGRVLLESYWPENVKAPKMRLFSVLARAILVFGVNLQEPNKYLCRWSESNWRPSHHEFASHLKFAKSYTVLTWARQAQKWKRLSLLRAACIWWRKRSDTGKYAHSVVLRFSQKLPITSRFERMVVMILITVHSSFFEIFIPHWIVLTHA